MLTPLTSVAREALRLYRSTGADLPFGNPLTAHGVARERYLWRLTDPTQRRTLVALNGVNRGSAGAWATLALAASNGFVHTTSHPTAQAAPGRLGAFAGTAFAGTAQRVVVDLGPDAKLDVAVGSPVLWPRRSTGGSGVFHVLPALHQHWHPWLLGAVAVGTAVVGGDTWEIDGWSVYAEKSWGPAGLPGSWWWGQAHGFAEATACVAFAGGEVALGPLRTSVTALVVRLPDGTLLRLGDPLLTSVTAELGDGWWLFRGRSAQWHVEVDGFGRTDAAHVLPVPVPTEDRDVPGTLHQLRGTVRVRVRHRGRVVWTGESRSAGLERGGIGRARAELVRRGADPEVTCARPVS